MEVHLSRIAKAKLENFGSEVSKEKGLYYYIPQALMMRTSHSSPEHPRLQSLQKKQMTRVFHNKAIKIARIKKHFLVIVKVIRLG